MEYQELQNNVFTHEIIEIISARTTNIDTNNPWMVMNYLTFGMFGVNISAEDYKGSITNIRRSGGKEGNIFGEDFSVGDLTSPKCEFEVY